MNGPLRRLLRHPAGLQLRLTLWCLLVCSIALAVFGAALLWQAQTVLQAGLDVHSALRRQV